MTNIEVLKAMLTGKTIVHAKNPEVFYRLERIVQVDTKDGWKDGVMYVRCDGLLDPFVRPIDGFVNFEVKPNPDMMMGGGPRAIPVPAGNAWR